MANPIKKLAGQTVVYGLGTILPRFLNYFLTPILTRAFIPAEYGIHGLLYALISFLNVIFAYGMETTFFNFNSRLENKDEVFSTSFYTMLISTSVFSVLLLSASPWISAELSTDNAFYSVTFIAWCIGIIATDALMSIPFARLRSQNKALTFSLYKLLNVVINFALTVFFISICKKAFEHGEDNFYAHVYNPEIGIGYCFLSNFIANAISLLLVSINLLKVRPHINKELLGEMLRYTWPLLILGLAGMVNETLDRLILKNLMVDKEQAQIAQGIYGASYKIAILMTIFIQAFRFAAEPYFFGKAKDKDNKKTYAFVMKYFVIFCLLLFLGTLLNLDWIKYLIDEPYWEGLKVVPILLLANLCLGVVINLSFWYKLSNRTRYGAIISFFGAGITIIINVLFVPKYSYMACAWATLAAYGGMMVLSYFLGQKFYPIKYNLKAMSVYAALTLVLYLISRSYSGMEQTAMKIILNNFLVALFMWIVYKLEITNLKKLSANVSSESESD